MTTKGKMKFFPLNFSNLSILKFGILTSILILIILIQLISHTSQQKLNLWTCGQPKVISKPHVKVRRYLKSMVCLCGNPNNVKDELEKVDEIKFLEGIGSSDHSSEIIDSISVKKISKASSEDHHEKDKKHLNHEQKPKLFRYASSPVKGIGGWQFNMGCRNLNPDSVANPQAFRKVKVQGSSTKDFVIQERNEVNKLKKLQKKPHSHSRSHSRSSVKAKDVKHLSAISEDPFNFP